MKPKPIVARAVGTEFLRRKFTSVALMITLFMLVILAIAVWLSTYSEWWWLFTIPLIILGVTGAAVLLLIKRLITKLSPTLTKQQLNDVKAFVDKLARLAEHLQTPMFIIVIKVAIDLIHPLGTPFIESVTSDSTTLHKDFLALERNF